MAAERDPRPGDGGNDGQDLEALVDDLLTEVGELKRQWGELQRALGGGVPRRRREAPRDAGEEAADPRRLIALEMLLAGRSREEVTDYLEREFGDDSADVMAEIFGDAG